MKNTLLFSVLGEPKAQPRPKAFRRGKFIGIYTPHIADDWKRQIAESIPDDAGVFDGPVSLTLWFSLPRPKSHFNAKGRLKATAPKWCVSKPDFDNLEKAVCDQLTQSGLWRDDSQVCCCYTIKRYVALREKSGLRVFIEPLK